MTGARLVRSFGYALSGLKAAWRHEPNFRLELAVGAGALALALWLGVSPLPVLLASALVLGFELLNSALEATLDHLAPERHPLVARAKDSGAAAVLVASALAALLGLWHLGPPLLARLGLL